MPARRPFSRGVAEHLCDLERQTQNSGPAANRQAFFQAERDFLLAIGYLPRVIPRFPLISPDFPLCCRIGTLIR